MTRMAPLLLIVSALLAGGGCSLAPKPALLTLHDLGNNHQDSAESGVPRACSRSQRTAVSCGRTERKNPSLLAVNEDFEYRPTENGGGAVDIEQALRTVTTLDAPTWLWDDRIRYRLRYDDASAVRFYTLDRWEAPLPALLEHKLNNAVDQPGFTLHIRLTQFEQEFDTPDTAKVIMKFDAEARALKDHRLVGKKAFKLQRMTASADARGAIQGFIGLSDQAVAKVQAWLGELAAMK